MDQTGPKRAPVSGDLPARRIVPLLFAALAAIGIGVARADQAFTSGTDLIAVYEDNVSPRLAVPDEDQQTYAAALAQVLAQAGLAALPTQLFLVVDRDAHVQAAMVWWKSPEGRYTLIGASPVSTGKPKGYEHFLTPLGVFEHSLTNPDFRAEGTPNAYGILGYGAAGLRGYDFGWQQAQRGWGHGGTSPMRLQVHSTDPAVLERLMGHPLSKGCIRIPSAMNDFLDRYGILDADYEAAASQGRTIGALRADRTVTPWAGRYLVVIDSQRDRRPAWVTRSR